MSELFKCDPSCQSSEFKGHCFGEKAEAGLDEKNQKPLASSPGMRFQVKRH